MPESADLLREAGEALRAAEILLLAGLYGDSIARAFYAMLYAARGLLADLGVHPKTHSGTLKSLGAPSSLRVSSCGSSLGNSAWRSCTGNVQTTRA